MKRLSVVSAAAAALLIVGCDRAPSIAGPEAKPAANPVNAILISKTNEQDVPWGPFEEDNPCNGDRVLIQGSTHYLFNVVVDDALGYHLYTRANSKGTGIGLLTNFTYKVSDQTVYSEQNPEGPVFTQTTEEQLLILAPRSEDNYIRHTIMHITGNANGVAASRDTTWTKCAG